MEVIIDMFKNLNLPQQKAINQELISIEFKAEKFLTCIANALVKSLKESNSD